MDHLPPEVADRIGPYYVYLLIDPRSGDVFYVGKGTRERLLAHTLTSAAAEIISIGAEEGPKRARIQQIREAGAEPRIDIVRHGLTEDAAFQIESSLIDCLGGLTNEIRGMHVDGGRATLKELAIRYGAEPLGAVPVPALLIKLGRWEPGEDPEIPSRTGGGFRPDITPSELYDATRVWWKISPASIERKGVRHAVAVHSGVTRAVYVIDRWFQHPSWPRVGFEGSEVRVGPIFDSYVGPLGKRIEFARGAQSPVTYWPRSATP